MCCTGPGIAALFSLITAAQSLSDVVVKALAVPSPRRQVFALRIMQRGDRIFPVNFRSLQFLLLFLTACLLQ